MKQGKGTAVRRRSKPKPPATERRKENGDTGTESLMKEVAEANAKVANSEERERVIPSRPC
jgi:hypothetical protein